MASGANNARSVKCIDTGEIFNTIKDAAKKYGLPLCSLSACCNGKIKTCGGMRWTIVTNIEDERQQKIKIARELCYGDAVINRLKKATTSGELNRIMKSARLGRL